MIASKEMKPDGSPKWIRWCVLGAIGCICMAAGDWLLGCVPLQRADSGMFNAATDEAIQPDHSYQMSGNQISVKTLDLNRDFSEIAAQLNAIVDNHFE